MVTLFHGWNPTPPGLPRPRFDAALRAVALPLSCDFYSRVPVVGMHLNDRLGCCTVAADANIIQGETFYGQGTETEVSDAAVSLAYQQSGYVPGNPSTDNGWFISDALAYLKATGLAGHKIAAYGQLANLADHVAVQTCIAEFGYLSIGINMPNSAMDQFNAGQPWDAVANDGGQAGGHCVCVCGYTAAGPVAWSWDRAQQLTWAFFDRYVEEAWPVVSPDWVSAATGKDPEGVDLVTLGQEFSAVTGQNPFPVSPSPPPAPVPPAPAPPPPPAPPAPAPPSPDPPAPPAGCTPFGRVMRGLRSWRYYSD